MPISQLLLAGTLVLLVAALVAAVVAVIVIARRSAPARPLDEEQLRSQRRLIGLAMGGFPLAELHDLADSQAAIPAQTPRWHRHDTGGLAT
jgi:hypothetical protein